MSQTKVSKDEIDPGVKLPRIVAIHPLTGNKVPVFVASYFQNDAVTGIPFHNERDLTFALDNCLDII